MQNIAPSRVIARRTRRLLEIALVLVSGGIFLGILGLALYVVPFTTISETEQVFDIARAVLLLLGVFTAIAGMGVALRAVTTKTENTLAYETGQTLGRYLGESYTFIRNINRRRLGYIDAVLVGPPGVLVLRIVGLEGKFLNEGGNWMRANAQGEWRPLWLINPTQEAVEDVRSMRRYLERHNLGDVPVFASVVFTRDESVARLSLQNPVVPATNLPLLHQTLQQNYLAKNRIDKAKADAVVKLLSED